MVYEIQRDEPVSEGIKRIIEAKTEAAIEHIDGEMDRHETVHEVRRRCKEVRAALRLVRPVLSSYSEENARYRDAARHVATVRDAQAAVETFDKHVRPAADSGTYEKTLEEMRETLVARRDDLATPSVLETQLENVREDLLEGREQVSELTIDGEAYDAVAGGLRKSYKRARNRMTDAYETPKYEHFHEWRKRVEYHRDHAGLLGSSWDGPMAARRTELQTLAESIGDETDLAEFATAMHDEELFDHATRETLSHVIEGRRARLQRRARPLGERLFAETPDQIVARFEQYWNAAQEIEHDAGDLVIADSRRSSKSKPKPRSTAESDDTDGTATQTPSALMEQHSDKWYRPDSDTYEYAVRTPDGNRAYRKTEEGAVSVIERYYAGRVHDEETE